jgi:hypothetical protein
VVQTYGSSQSPLSYGDNIKNKCLTRGTKDKYHDIFIEVEMFENILSVNDNGIFLS